MAGKHQCLIVTAELAGPIYLPHHRIHLDALVAAAKAARDGLPPPLDPSLLVPIEIPIQREPWGRFHLCSSSMLDVEISETQHTHRRPPIEQYQALAGPKLRRVDVSTAENKAYRIPRPVAHLRGDQIIWYAVAQRGPLLALLEQVTHLGRRRAVGLGRVRQWTVEPCDPWDGFPIMRVGKALRPLPLDWPGLRAPRTGFSCLTYPYWAHPRKELCAIP